MNKDHICKSGLSWGTEVSFICEMMGIHAEHNTSKAKSVHKFIHGKPMPKNELDPLEEEMRIIRDEKLEDVTRRRTEEIENVCCR